ncbi:MAG: FAD-dependent thymidylate synthase [Actinobacteria bacterium]|nr:FAD-dependent thymidylate synthase [Actinomycetota bacterium]
MKVRLLRHTPDPEKTVAVAARLCYSPVGVDELNEKLGDDEIRKLVRFVVNSGHLSTTEHISFTFGIEGVSRALTHQLVRHRIASYNQQSQRYVKFRENFEYITPPSLRNNPKIKERFDYLIREAHKFYMEMLDNGIEAEDARYILPNASETKIIVTMNGRELLHFFTVRCCNRAQWEIRELATQMLKVVKKICPTVFEKAGPNCLRGPCPEGKFKCDNPPKASDFDA